MSKLKDKLAASVRQARDATVATAAPPAVNSAPPAAEPLPRPPASVTLPAGAPAPAGFEFPDRVWPD